HDSDEKYLEYFNISDNMIFFSDVFYKKIKFNYDNKQIITNFAVQFSEKVESGEIIFEAFIKEVGNLEGISGHFEFDAQEEAYEDDFLNYPKAGHKADFRIGKMIFRNGFPVSKKE